MRRQTLVSAEEAGGKVFMFQVKSEFSPALDKRGGVPNGVALLYNHEESGTCSATERAGLNVCTYR